MKATDIEEGGHYTAKVSGKLVTVRVDKFREVDHFLPGGSRTVYDVTNLATSRRSTFRSAAKFRCRAD